MTAATETATRPSDTPLAEQVITDHPDWRWAFTGTPVRPATDAEQKEYASRREHPESAGTLAFLYRPYVTPAFIAQPAVIATPVPPASAPVTTTAPVASVASPQVITPEPGSVAEMALETAREQAMARFEKAHAAQAEAEKDATTVMPVAETPTELVPAVTTEGEK